MTVLRRVWLCAWKDGRCHSVSGDAPPARWVKLEAEGECIVHEVPEVTFPDPPQPSRVPVKTAA